MYELQIQHLLSLVIREEESEVSTEHCSITEKTGKLSEKGS